VSAVFSCIIVDSVVYVLSVRW